MSIKDEELGYEHHLEFFNKLGHLSGKTESDLYWYQEAEHLHSLCVCDAIRDVHIDVATLSQRITNPEANFHLRFGIGRRTKFIWLSLRGLLRLIPPGRTEPLLSDDVEEAARDLNVIYINIRGTLDNFAWLLLDLFGDEKSRKLPPVKVSLFGSEFLKAKNMADIAVLMKQFVGWNKELSSRRDPAAHRIPLSVPPAVIDAESRKEYEVTSSEYAAAFNDAVKTASEGGDSISKFEKTRVLFERLERIGKFVPIFVHHPNEDAIKIYPTVPQDIGQLVRIARGISKAIIARTG